MVTTNKPNEVVDPLDIVNQVLEQTWSQICSSYDITGCLPDIKSLFEKADLSSPTQAAEAILVAMLQEVVERVSRFSSWYKQPARAFGLASIKDSRTHVMRWMLAPEALQRWQNYLILLAGVVRRYSGLIQALILVDDMMDDFDDDPCVTARCHCYPPLVIHLRKSVLDKSEILCQHCLEPFT